MLEFLLVSMGITTSVVKRTSIDILQDGLGAVNDGVASPSGYLLLETGDKLILEDGLGFLLLEG